VKKIFILWCLGLISFSYGATIKGHIHDKWDLVSIVGADVVLKDRNIRTSTDVEGFFILKNIPAGKHVLNISSIGYYQEDDTVYIKDTAEIVDLEIKLIFLTDRLDTAAEIENYHRYIQELDQEHILKITLDSLGIDDSVNSCLKVYSTLRNETDTPLYIIVDQEFANMVSAVIHSSGGEAIEPSTLFASCLVRLPMSSHFFKIEPHSSLKYPPVLLSRYNFRKYPAGIYSIKLEYFNKKWLQLPGVPRGSKQNYLEHVFYYNAALRGKYVSSNSLQFDNSGISKVK
jgi:hypothetical protein